MTKYIDSMNQNIINIVQKRPKKESMKVHTALLVVALFTISFIPVAKGM